jgi:hypothetical protein
MFHPDYKYITDKLPASLKKRAYQRLLHHSHSPIPLKLISEKNDWIEDYLRRALKVYQNSLNRKRKTMKYKNSLQPEVSYPSFIDELTALPQKGALKELKQQLLKHNRDTFSRFMQDLIITYKKQVETN